MIDTPAERVPTREDGKVNNEIVVIASLLGDPKTL